MASGIIEDGGGVQTKQPIGAARSAERKPIARGLKFLASPSAFGLNSANGFYAHPTKVFTASVSPCLAGMAIVHANGGYTRPSGGVEAIANSGITAVVLCRPISGTEVLFGSQDAGYGTVNWRIRLTGTYVNIEVYNEASTLATAQIYVADWYAYKRPILVGFSYSETSGVITGFSEFATTVTAAQTGKIKSSSVSLNFGAVLNGDGSYFGETYMAAIWDRVLSFAEIERLYTNPWQLFEADNDPVFASLGGSPVTINCATGAALASDYAANVASPITVAGAVGAALANDYAAGVSSPITIAASPGSAVASDYAANVASAITVAGSVGAAVGAGLSASVSSGATISATTGAAVGAGLAAGVASPITVAASAGAATASGLSAGISTGNEIAASTGAAVGAGLAAGVSSPITVAANAGPAVAAGLQASISVGATIPAGIGAAVALGLTGNVAGQITVAGGVGAAIAAGLAGSVTVGGEIEASVGTATAAGLAATITNPTVVLTAATGTRGGFGVQMQLAARRAQIQTGRRRN